jgi:threonyl-tRNA synthetase
MSISVQLPDGSSRELGAGATAADLAADIGPGLAKAALIATIDGEQVDLNVELTDGATVALITDRQDEGLETIRHSTSHVLAQAVLELWPGSTFAIGPPIEHGFYYDFELPGGATFTDEDLERIDAKMREIIDADQPFIRSEMSAADALELMAEHQYKRETIERVTGGDQGVHDVDLADEVADDGSVSFYRNTDSFVDLCRGPHVPSTGRLGHFKLMSVAGAYWRGDEKRPMLQRIYGTAWANKKDLKAHLDRLEEAAKRDHRKLANELDLVSWPSELGPGLAVWHPKGALVRKIIEDYSRERHENGGYEFAYTPHIAKSVLWETSGHLDFYADGMYPPMEMDGATYYPKPMNCPFHVMIYKSSQRSYRDLPMRIFELGTVYRYELSGAVHGLLRSRGFTQDDSHIFTTREDIQTEVSDLLDFVLSVLRAFGFHDFQAKLSTKPLEKAVGDDEIWEMATEGLRMALENHGLDYIVDHGGGAFYGPKIDVDVKDAIGRAWQLSTIQLDFQLPERFELEYVASDGERKRPVMVHRALLGSVERFFGVMLEHYAGAFPVWLAPMQVQVLPVAEAHADYAESVRARIREAGFRVEVIEATDPLGKRVRAGKTAKLPYVLVVGDDDVANDTLGVNARGQDVERDVPVAAFLERLAADVENKV